MFASHRQNHRRLVLAAAIGSGLFWSGVGLPIPAQAQGPDPATQLYVSNITVGWVRTSAAGKRAVAVVDIVDGNWNPVNGALVVGNWSGCFKQLNDSDVTETVCTTIGGEPMACVDGRAVIWGKAHACRNGSCPFTFTITGVQKAGMTYVPVQGKTSSFSLCNPFATANRGTKATFASSRQVVTRKQPMPTRRLARPSRR